MVRRGRRSRPEKCTDEAIRASEQPPTVLYAVTVATSAYVALRGQLGTLRKEGYRVVLLCSPDPGLLAFAAAEGVEVFPIGMTRGLASPRDLLALVKTLRVIVRVRPTVVNMATPKASLVVGLAACLARVPVRIYSLWGLRLEGERAGSHRFRLLWLAERLTSASATVVLCASEGLRARAVALRLVRAQEARVLGRGSTNGVDIDRFHPPTEAERCAARAMIKAGTNDIVVGFIGRLVADKGVEVLLDAFEQVHSCLPARLLVVGDYDDADELPAAVRARLESHPYIQVTGLQADTASWYTAMDVVVLPSKREGLSNVLLEAAACGLPVITSDATGCPDAIEDGRTGIVVAQHDAARLAREILAFGRNPERRRAMGTDGRAFVERNYTQALVWSQIIGFYRELRGTFSP